MVHADGTADLFVEPEKVDEAVRQHLGNAVRLHDRAAFRPALGALAGKCVLADPDRAVAAIFAALEEAGATVIAARDPAVLPKAIKNAVEIAGQRAAQARDGAALARFLHWLSIEAEKLVPSDAAGGIAGGGLTELSAAARLRAFREETGQLKDLSFDTISGAGPNGAGGPLSRDRETDRPIERGSLYWSIRAGNIRTAPPT